MAGEEVDFETLRDTLVARRGMHAWHVAERSMIMVRVYKEAR